MSNEVDHKNIMTSLPKRRLVIGITGASGVILGIRTLEILRDISDIETHLVLSQAAEKTISHELDRTLKEVVSLADIHYNNQDIDSTIASGSYKTMGMIIIPCSIKSLSAVANAYANDLISRAADVTLKEGRPLILVLRETPFHIGHIRLMNLAAKAGSIIFPPIPSFYNRPKTINDIVDNFVGRVLERLGIENDKYLPWAGTGN